MASSYSKPSAQMLGVVCIMFILSEHFRARVVNFSYRQ